MTVQVVPLDSTDPFAAILAIGDSWFWYPKNSLIAFHSGGQADPI